MLIVLRQPNNQDDADDDDDEDNDDDEAVYDENDKAMEKASYKFEKLLEDLSGAEEELNHRAEKFVAYYVKD